MLRMRLIFKGGKGSGNFGHAGRSGKVGGSGQGNNSFKDMRAREIFPNPAINKPKYGIKVIEYKNINPLELFPTQQYIDGAELNKYKLGKGYSHGKPISVVFRNNKYIIVDGHHRAAYAILTGIQNIEVKVLEIL